MIFWLPSDTTAAVAPTPSGTDWTLHTNNVSRQMLVSPNASAMTSLVYTPDAADHLVAGTAMGVQFVSRILPPQAIAAQTVQIGLRMLEDNAGNNLTFTWKLYATNTEGTVVLGTLVPIRTSGGGEIPTALTGEIDSVTSTAFSDPGECFRLVLEIGAGGTPAATSGTQGHNFSMSFGCDAAEFPQDNDTTSGNPYLLFAGNLHLGIANTEADFDTEITGITKDSGGNVATSVTVTAFKIVDGVPVYVNRVVSDGTTGAFSVGCFDEDAAYRLVFNKAGSPNIQHVSDILTPVEI